MYVAFEERLLPGRGADPVDGLPRVGQSQAEQRAGHQLSAQPYDDLAEVNLALAAGQVGLRDERGDGLPPGFDTDLAATGRDVVTHHPVRHHSNGVVLVEEPAEDALCGMSLLPRRVQVIAEPAVDH